MSIVHDRKLSKKSPRTKRTNPYDDDEDNGDDDEDDGGGDGDGDDGGDGDEDDIICQFVIVRVASSARI